MFGNKKHNLPPRPNLPDPEHMLEDLSNASIDDIAFKIINEDKIQAESSTIMTNQINSEDIYKKVKVYLNVKEQLKQLETTLKREQEQLQKDNEEIRALADSIRKQAQAALIT
ncbi:hypothetical protein KPH14_003141 [Odynerus spinipes]|uniref:Uncharacterized protein n=1 Tax=Odynerus spinipes TaxID=1348599 RepID=A0AAD9VUG4_9HYME|nr:hypothetical protein KPH14_003141 [Odynerus spinipes]